MNIHYFQLVYHCVSFYQLMQIFYHMNLNYMNVMYNILLYNLWFDLVMTEGLKTAHMYSVQGNPPAVIGVGMGGPGAGAGGRGRGPGAGHPRI